MKKIIAGLFCLVLFAGCNQDKINELESQLEEAKNQIENIQNQIEDIQNQIGNLETSVNNLQNAVADFDYENWRYVVPEVIEATENVESEFKSLKSIAF